MNWLLLANIVLTLMSCVAAYAVVSSARDFASSDWARIRRDTDLQIAELSSAVDKIAHQLAKQHMRLAARQRLDSSPDPEPQPHTNGSDADAIRKQLGAQAGMLTARR